WVFNRRRDHRRRLVVESGFPAVVDRRGNINRILRVPARLSERVGTREPFRELLHDAQGAFEFLKATGIVTAEEPSMGRSAVEHAGAARAKEQPKFPVRGPSRNERQRREWVFAHQPFGFVHASPSCGRTTTLSSR